MRPNRLLVAAAAALTAALVALVATPPEAHAQLGSIFSNNPPRPPATVPRGEDRAPSDEEEVPDVPPQGRVLPTRPLPPGASLTSPAPVQSQPLPPPPGAAQAPPGSGVQGQPLPSVATAPNPPVGRGQQKGAPPAPTALQPGDEVVTEPPAQKIINKQAVFSGLDKITGRIISFDVDINETVQFGALRVRPRACYTRPPTESANTDAFVEVEEITLQGEVKKIFSGWMFAASPGLHGVEHPIYDVWLTDCKGAEAVAAAQPETPPAPRPAAPPPARRQPRQQQPQPSLPAFR